MQCRSQKIDRHRKKLFGIPVDFVLVGDRRCRVSGKNDQKRSSPTSQVEYVFALKLEIRHDVLLVRIVPRPNCEQPVVISAPLSSAIHSTILLSDEVWEIRRPRTDASRPHHLRPRRSAATRMRLVNARCYVARGDLAPYLRQEARYARMCLCEHGNLCR